MRKRKHRELASTNAISVNGRRLSTIIIVWSRHCSKNWNRSGSPCNCGKQNIVCSGKSTKISVEYIHLTAIVALLRARGFKYEKIIVCKQLEIAMEREICYIIHIGR